ncbi:MAG: Hsp20/alpha crystallin family protein [Vulcanimicrobiaceae bacterium]
MATLTKRTNGEGLRAPMFGQGSDYGSSIFDQLSDQLRTMRRMSGALLGSTPMESTSSFFPQIELYEKDGSYVIEALVPGFRRDEIQIDCTDNRVTISGGSERQSFEEQLKGRVHYSEIQRKDFSRTITVPTEIDPERVTARLQDGLLTIVLPIVTPSAQKRVPITA